MIVKLLAGQETIVRKVGWFFRLMTAEQAVDVRIVRNRDGKEFYRGNISSGVGIDFLSNPAPFVDSSTGKIEPYDTIFIKSEVDQTIDIWSELIKADDDRLSGNFDINAALSVAQTAASEHNIPVVQNIAVATEVLPIRANRKTALIQVDGDVYMGSTDGVIVNGNFTWENQSALTLVPVSGSVNVRINEDYN